MRIATAQAYDATIARLTQRQAELADAQVHISHSKRVLRPSDDPLAAARAERALASQSKSEAALRSAQASHAAMTQAEAALGDADELLQRAREALVAAGNATYDDSDRKVFAEQIRSLREQLLAVANRGDGGGGYLFGGQGSSAPPFVDAAGGVQYRGTRGTSIAGDGLPMSLDGAATFLSAPTGNGVFETRAVTSSGSAWIAAGRVTDPSAITASTYRIEFTATPAGPTYSVLRDGAPTALTNLAYASGQAIEFDGMALTITGAPAAGDAFEVVPSQPTQSVFDLLDRAAAGLAAPPASAGARAQATSDDLRDLDAVLGRVAAVRAGAGSQLNQIDNAAAQLDDDALAAKTQRSEAEDLDLVAALAELETLQTSQSAALQAYAAVQRLSLFDYIK